MRLWTHAWPWMLGALLLFGVTRPAQADSLWTDTPSDGSNYLPVEELSYEIIVDRNDGYDATVRQRVAIHNAGNEQQDFVLTLVVPRATELRGMNVAHDGEWLPGTVVNDVGLVESRPSGAVFARIVPSSPRGIHAAEITGFGLEPGTTMQIELVLRAYPTMVGDRWKLDLPRRELRAPNLSRERRIIVRGLDAEESFFVDDGPNLGAPFLSSRVEDAVTVAWPAPMQHGKLLDGHAEAVRADKGEGGKLHLYLRLGTDTSAKPDYVVLLVDRSRSTSPRFASQVPRVIDALRASLPPETLLTAAAFAREATPLFSSDAAALQLGAPQAKQRLEMALQGDDRSQGTNLSAALTWVDARLAEAKARRPLIVVVTDGLMPITIALDGWREKLRARQADLLFIVDDPILAQYGIDPTHPLLDTAGQLGARVSVTTLAGLSARDGDKLLAAPRVMGELSFVTGPRAQLEGDVPRGLVAGGFVRLEGSYSGKAPRTITVRGRTGDKRVVGRLRVRGSEQLPSALGLATQGSASDLGAGFVFPPGYTISERREALAVVEQSGRGGFEARGRLDHDLIQRYLRTRVRPRVRVCYNQALSRIEDVGGRVSFDFEVGKGEVMWAALDPAELRGADKKLLDCLHDAAWALEIPAGKLDGAAYRVRYPINLTVAADRKRSELTDDDKVWIDVLLERADVYSR